VKTILIHDSSTGFCHSADVVIFRITRLRNGSRVLWIVEAQEYVHAAARHRSMAKWRGLDIGDFESLRHCSANSGRYFRVKP
jgi:hypothetical protein